MSENTISLGELLHEYQLGLVVVAGNSEQTSALPVQWVHVSELVDPTPFLPPRTVLLTTGTRFRSMPRQEDADEYVKRLISAGTTGLGIAVGLHRDRVPPRFITACDRLGLPLFRVPYDTAFISIVQTTARLLEAQSRERDHWAIESHRAVAHAALHHSGLAQVAREASQRLGRWLCITDRSGRVIEVAPQSSRPQLPLETIRREVRALIEDGRSATEHHNDLRVQTLETGHALLGAIVVSASPTLDYADRALLDFVSSLAAQHLARRSDVDRAEQALRNAMVRLLLAGDYTLADQLGNATQSRPPLGQLVVVRYPQTRDSAAQQDLVSLDAGSTGLVRGTVDQAALLISETRHLPAIRRHFSTHSWPAGISERGTRESLTALLQQAERGLSHALTSGTNGPVDYQPSLHHGVLHLLEQSAEARQSAELLLSPVRQHDTRHDDAIEQALTAWLTHHGQISLAAAEIGVHRHTLRARIHTAAELLQVDLESPDIRANLWAALRLTRDTDPNPAARNAPRRS